MSRRSFLASSGKMLAVSGLCMHFPALAQTAKPIAQNAKYHSIDRLHQILIVDGFGMPKRTSEILQARTQQFKQTYPFASHTLWTGEMLRECIGKHFDKTVLSAFDTLKPYSYKSDLARYCLLYALGGLYSDLSVVHYGPWQIKKKFGIAGFLEVSTNESIPNAVSNSLMWSQPSHPTLALAIEAVVRHCDTRYYGRHAIDPTGPALLYWAWASTHVDQWESRALTDQTLGISKMDWRPTEGAELTFFPDGTENSAVGQRPRRLPGDARYLELAGTNHYIEMWHRRDVYR